MSIYSSKLIFPDQTIKAQSGKQQAASEGDVTSLGTGQELNLIVYHQQDWEKVKFIRW